MDIVERLNVMAEKQRRQRGDYLTYGEPDNEIIEAATEITRLREENKRMREALKPFADRAGKLDGYWLDHDTCWSPRYGDTAVTIADLRRAYATLEITGGE